MKTFSDEALAALQRGDAIVSASVEIIPNGVTLIPDAITEGTTVEVDWYQNTFVQTGGNDEARMGIAFLNAAKVQLGSTTWAALSQPTSWTARSVSASAPADARYVRVFMNMVRLAGTNNDGFIDDITRTIGGVSAPLTNGDAESGTTGWTSILGGLDTKLDAPGAHGGSRYFYGGTSAETTAYQDYATFVSQGGGDAIRLWGGYGAADLPSDEGTSTFQGIGDRGLINQSAGAIGGSAQNLTLSLSGIEPAALALLDPSEVKGASAVVRRLIYDSAGKTLLGAYVYTRGRVDELKTSEVVGGSATIELSIEGAARGLGRRGGRIRSDADQRLVSPTDGFYRVVSAAPKKTLYWGGKRPSVAGSAVGGGGGTSSSGTSPSSF